MSLVFNIAKGRTVEFHNRVANNDPTNSALTLVVLAETGLEANDVLQDYPSLGDILFANDEVTNAGYSRIELTNADIAEATPDYTYNYTILSFATQLFPTISVGDSWRMLLICYDSDTTGGSYSDIVPMYGIDLLIDGAAVVPTGTDIIISFPFGYAVAR